MTVTASHVRPALEGIPLPTVLSWLLVAFVLEVDDQLERRLPHRTSEPGRHGPDAGPWLVSHAFWVNALRHIPPEGVTSAGLDAVTGKGYGGLERWGYVTVGPDPTDARSAPPRRDWLVELTAAAADGLAVWSAIPAAVETGWVERFGAEAIDGLRTSLRELTSHLARDLPDYLPVVGVDLVTLLPRRVPGSTGATSPAGASPLPRLDLAALLGRVLLAFTVAVEGRARVSLPLGANVLRVLDHEPQRVGGLAGLTGLSREAVAVSLSSLARKGLVVVDPDPNRRGHLARLTTAGASERAAFVREVSEVESAWAAAHGLAVAAVRAAATALLAAGAQPGSVLARGLQPGPGSWRSRGRYAIQSAARVADPLAALPHHPVVTHRGGWPDGS